MDWVLGSFALISVVIALGALRKIATMQEQVARKVEGTFRQTLGALKTNADETDKMLKSMSDRILKIEDKVNRSQSKNVNTNAELMKLRKENARLREKL
jgi:septal ring factor EnvC (AmiA/AmiB activator)